MEQRSRTANRQFTVKELAADAWDAAELPDLTPLGEWVAKRPECTSGVNIPEARPAILSPSPMFDPHAVHFGKDRSEHIDCRSQDEAAVVVLLANEGSSGWVKVPPDDDACKQLRDDIVARMRKARARFGDLADSRTSDPRLQVQIVDQLMRWFVRGRVQATRDKALPGAVDNSDDVD